MTEQPSNSPFAESSPNSVFAGVPSMSREKAAAQELGFEIPTHQVPLPSEGRVYPPSHPLHGQSSVLIRSMTTREEDILFSTALVQKGTVITELIKSCLVTKGVEVQDLLSGDRNALMLTIRVAGYGPDYTCPMKCSKCDHVEERHQVNLGDMPIRPLEIDPVSPGQNRFRFFLPSIKKTVEFKFLTVGEEEEILAAMEKLRKRGLQNQKTVTSRLVHNIVSVEGNEDKAYIRKFCEWLPAIDSLALRTYIDQHEPTVEMQTEFSCPACGETTEVAVPFGVGFFWPGISAKSGTDNE